MLTSHTKDYSGKHIAEVVSVDDPDKRCRIKVNVYDIFDGVPIDDLPWATFVLPMGSRPREGAINPLQVGDQVWVEFVNGDTRRPLITGCAQATPDGKVNLPPEVCQGDGQYEHKRTDSEPKPETPPYYQDAVYCQNHALIQISRAGNIRITQMTSGSNIELMPDGKIIVHSEAELFVSSKGKALYEHSADVEKNISGAMTITASGITINSDVTVNGNISASGSIMDASGNSNHHRH